MINFVSKLDDTMEIPKFEHQTYPSTFLRTIEWVFTYPQNKTFENWKTNIVSLWKKVDQTSKFNVKQESIDIQTPNYKFTFWADKCILRFNPDNFTSFRLAVKFINEHRDYFLDLCGNKIKSSRIHKVNLIPGGREDNESTNIGFLGVIFSNSLISNNDNYSELEQSLVAKITQATFLKDGYELILNYGFSCNKRDDSQLMGILEITAIDQKPCAFSNFIKNAENMNEIIFNLFRWSISDEILSIMEN